MPDLFGNLGNLLHRAKFTEQEEKNIRKILESPEIEKILNREESERIKERADLKKQLDTVDSRHQTNIKRRAQEFRDADEELKEAKIHLNEATQNQALAFQLMRGSELQKEEESSEIRKQLYEGRDRRIDDFLFHLSDADERIRYMSTTTEFRGKIWGTGIPTVEYESNLESVKAARGVIAEAMDSIRAAALLPISRNELSELMTGWTHKLTPLFKKFEVLCPYVDANGDVKMEFQISQSEAISKVQGELTPDSAQNSSAREPARRQRISP
ncbi:hypothetical protein [Burkholderia glumae]|uniref:hypothetical protein n=1 Tax=Burkholderia glumae TaxID=337 RepID=UPI0012FD60E3|nr:hypothetical protein [Burkholderia glumae]QHE09815.1 hypothetical protein GQR88_05055 [Burkholderia glumae AU6208]